MWSKTIGPDSKWVIGASITSTTFLACISYAMIIGDLYSALAVTAGLTGLPTQRNACIVAVTLAVVSPLCFLKSLAALAPFSVGIRNGVSLGILSLGSCCLLSVVAAARRHRRHPSSCFAVPAAYCSPAASLASASRTPTSCLACLASFSRRVIELAGYADVPEITPYRASGFPRFMHCHLFF